MPPESLHEDHSDYLSSEDSDFAPESAPPAESDESSESESDNEGGANKSRDKPKTTTRKRKRAKAPLTEEAEDVGFENSGDEEIVEKGLKRQKKKGRKGREDDDEGGEGGFVRTRRMAALAIEEKKPLATTAAATVDVDALWASMTSGTANNTAKSIEVAVAPDTNSDSTKDAHTASDGVLRDDGKLQSNSPGTPQPRDLDREDMIMIQRTYNFAGKVHVEEKLVPRDSAEARLWLESQSLGTNLSQPLNPNITKPLRPPKKARRSIFEPITEPLPRRTDLRFGTGAAARNGIGMGANGAAAAKKLNTVEKSKMDWAGFVDKEGIKDELEVAGKSKGAYLDQKEFLARVEEKREEESRKARLKALS